MITLTLLLVVTAFIVTIIAAMGRAPLWIAVLLLVVLELVRAVPR